MRKKTIEIILVVSLILIMVTGAIVGMFSLRAMAHLKKRNAGMHEILTL